MQIRSILISGILLIWSVCVSGQFNVGHTSITFTDPARNNRSIPCEVFYPATLPGDDTEVEAGIFPVIVFGHGFLMNSGDYDNLPASIVPEGYIMVFPDTETGFPDHEAYGLDLAFVPAAMATLGTENAVSIFYTHVAENFAIMGHSMGGGATWLAASGNQDVDCIVGLAPAETTPTAIGAGANVSCPVLVLSGSEDTVTPPGTNHEPIYNESSSACKFFVSIMDGSHCGYADSGSLCDLGEIGFSGLDRETQQDITQDLLKAWFSLHLYGNTDALSLIEGYDNTQPNTTTTGGCSTLQVEGNEMNELIIAPNPVDASLNIFLDGLILNNDILINITDAQGKTHVEQYIRNAGGQSLLNLDVRALVPGYYMLRVSDLKGRHRYARGFFKS